MDRKMRLLVGLAASILIGSLGSPVAAEPPNAAKAGSQAGSAPSGEPAPGPTAERAAVDLVRTRAAIETHRVRLTGTLQPSVRAKLQDPIRQAGVAASNKSATPTELLDVASRAVAKAFTGTPKNALDALALVALMEAEKDARSEWSEIQSRQEAMRQAKDCRGEPSCLEKLGAKGGTSKEMADKAIEDAKNQRDSLRELAEADSRRAKLAMARSDKLTSTLSGLLKKIAGTSEAITQNLK